MKSRMIANMPYISDPENFSGLQVCESGAGFYIGTMYNNPEGFDEPGSRESMEYFGTYKEAMNAFLAGLWTQRTRP